MNGVVAKVTGHLHTETVLLAGNDLASLAAKLNAITTACSVDAGSNELTYVNVRCTWSESKDTGGVVELVEWLGDRIKVGLDQGSLCPSR